MKNTRRHNVFIITLFFFAFPLIPKAQTLTGLWIGSVTNDSASVRKDQSFEIALTEYKGKVYGYSRNEFIVNDTLYYIVKRVKGTIVQGTPYGEGDICEVTDEKIIAYNFQGKLDKKVKVTSTFRRNLQDSVWYLDGTWKTNATKNYYAVSGKINLGEEKDITASKIFPHLEELNLANDVAFYSERKKEEERHTVKIVQPENRQTASVVAVIKNDKTTWPEIKEPDIQPAKPVIVQTGVDVPEKAGSETVTVKTPDVKPVAEPAPTSVNDEQKKGKDMTTVKPVETKPLSTVTGKENTGAIAKNNLPKKTEKNKPPDVVEISKPSVIPPSTVSNNNKKSETKPSAQPVVSTPAPTSVAAAENQNTKTIDPQTMTRTAVAQTVIEKPKIKLTAADIKPKTVDIGGRKSEFSQAVLFTGDSLEIALYDNGEIDGDTVSVYMNGQVIMAHQGLKASAIKKTIHLPANEEEYTLVMYAESLGRLPPNTGLLVIRDGDDVYNLRFSSDFQKSSGIVLKRNR